MRLGRIVEIYLPIVLGSVLICMIQWTDLRSCWKSNDPFPSTKWMSAPEMQKIFPIWCLSGSVTSISVLNLSNPCMVFF